MNNIKNKKINLCKNLLKILSREFEIDEVKNHILECKECIFTIYKLVEGQENNPLFLFTKNFVKQKLEGK
ncbi:MAG: hypothetical protein QXO40_04115 [Candidatus Aenigmatarchaeota archaeon]